MSSEQHVLWYPIVSLPFEPAVLTTIPRDVYRTAEVLDICEETGRTTTGFKDKAE